MGRCITTPLALALTLVLLSLVAMGYVAHCELLCRKVIDVGGYGTITVTMYVNGTVVLRFVGKVPYVNVTLIATDINTRAVLWTTAVIKLRSGNVCRVDVPKRLLTKAFRLELIAVYRSSNGGGFVQVTVRHSVATYVPPTEMGEYVEKIVEERVAKIEKVIAQVKTSLEKELREVRETVANLSRTVTSLTKAITKVSTGPRIDEAKLRNIVSEAVSSEVKPIKILISDLRAKVSDLSNRVNTLESKVSSIEARVRSISAASIKVDLTPVTTILNELSKRVSRIEAMIERTSEDYAAFGGRVGTLEESVASISERITYLEQKVEILLDAVNTLTMIVTGLFIAVLAALGAFIYYIFVRFRQGVKLAQELVGTQ